MGLYAVALAGSLIEFRSTGAGQRRVTVPGSPLTMMRMSAQAREATERARRRGGYGVSGLTLLDVGLISLQSSSEGMVMRRSRTVSLDDDGVRPYITLHVQSEEADRNAVLRFEIIDHNGETQYIHEMKTYLRDGEMNILADHQLPLLDNAKLNGAGDWDLRVSVDGGLVGLLNFTTTPSLSARRRQLNRDSDRPALRLEDEIEDDAPVSLQDLLRAEERSRSERR
jgi:hypothetical protein